MGLLIYLLGAPALAGVAVMMLLIPLEHRVSKASSAYRKKTLKNTDRRIQMLSELLAGSKMIKLCAPAATSSQPNPGGALWRPLHPQPLPQTTLALVNSALLNARMSFIHLLNSPHLPILCDSGALGSPRSRRG